ncbi:MAG: type II toxin-antitoxin system RelE/ParE family toxin [Verrucomicrobiota bacterium]
MKLALLTAAIEDLADGRDFYEQQGEGLGDYFQDSLFSDINSLKLYGGIHRSVHGFHRLLSKRFPYAIYYLVHGEDRVVVYRVLDCRQNPRRISDALKPGD